MVMWVWPLLMCHMTCSAAEVEVGGKTFALQQAMIKIRRDMETVYSELVGVVGCGFVTCVGERKMWFPGWVSPCRGRCGSFGCGAFLWIGEDPVCSVGAFLQSERGRRTEGVVVAACSDGSHRMLGSATQWEQGLSSFCG